MIKDKLEIILITYNRKYFLERTLKQLFAENSPIKDFPITILDNKSTDGSSELIEEYRAKFPNIKHIIHNRNIGGNANIARTFEIASKEYLWVICDDDIYHWENWTEVENAINNDYDAVVVALHNITDRNNISDIIFQLTFLPGGIYKTSTINENVIRNIYDNISNIFPHIPVAINIANKNGRFYLLNKPLVENGWEIAAKINDKAADGSYLRGNDTSELFPVTQNLCWYIGYVNSLTLLNKKNAVMDGIKSALTYPPLGTNIYQVVEYIVNQSLKNKKSINLFYDFFCRVDFKTKLIMLYYRYCPIFYRTPKGVHVKLFNKLKIRILPYMFCKN